MVEVHEISEGGLTVEARCVSTKVVCLLLGVSQPTLWRLIRDGRFPAGIRVSPGLVRWRLSTVTAWLDEKISQAEAGGGE